MILAAGLGTRLRPLTDELPKPLVPVGDRSVLGHIAEQLVGAGFSDVVLNTHYSPEKFSSHIERLGLFVHLVHEPKIRGTAGGIAGARPHFGPPPIVVWNGDILARPPLAELQARAHLGLAFCVAPRPRGEGTVGLDGEGNLVRLRDETFGAEVAGADYIGIAALGGDVLAALPAEGCLIGDCALPRLRRGETVRTAPTTHPWADVGSLGAYHAANLAWLVRTAGPGASWVHPRALISGGVTLEHSLIGDGAKLDGVGVVARCVVWPGARATAPLADVIVTTAGRRVPVR